MGLRASQQRVLDQTEIALRDSDPRLVALFAIFSRLNLNEEMPQAEQLRARAARLTSGLAAAGRWTVSAHRLRFLVPAALAALVSAVLVGAGFPSPAKCAAAHRGPRSAPVSRLVRCPRMVAYPLYITR
jgi:hypothetical protein